MSYAEASLALPPAPPAPSRVPFPLVASLAPLAASIGLWAVTRSGYVLAFAALSPLVALATMIDRKRQSTKELRRTVLARREARTRLRHELERRHNAERAELRRRHPEIDIVLAGPLPPGSWRGTALPALVAVGTGAAPSRTRITGEPVDDGDHALITAAHRIADAVVEVETTPCLGIAGPPLVARALARAVICRLAVELPPTRMLVARSSHPAWEWLNDLPHAAAPGTRDAAGFPSPHARTMMSQPSMIAVREAGEPATAAAELTIAIADAIDALPPGTGSLVFADPALGWRYTTRDRSGTVVVDTASEAHARGLADRLRHAASDEERAVDPVPAHIGFESLLQPGGGGLACAIGESRDGVETVDLVRDGPHAVVGGTTGSGKSELLVTWVCAMATGRTPDEVQFLLVDFKGGAAFAPLTTLPHCVGVISDLDPGRARRAIESMRAELGRRERVLSELGVADVSAAGGVLARLVIVVDEYASMVETFPSFHDLFADLTARGRSLGIHTILCTQRPSGVVRDAVFANCPLRISLRVMNAADSAAVVYSDAAAALPPAPGRCVIARAGTRSMVQLALASPDDVAALAGSSAHYRHPRRPWLDPLPPVIALETLAPSEPPTLLLGVEDVPREQRQSLVRLEPASGSHLLAIGDRGSGRSGLLALVQRQCTDHVLVPADAEGAWDTIAALAEPDPSTPVRAVLLDDIDALPGRFDDEHRGLILERLAGLARRGDAGAPVLIATTTRVTGEIRGLASLFPRRLLLGLADRREHLLADGDPALWAPEPLPGSGQWRGNRIQLAHAGPLRVEPTPEPPIASFEGTGILVSRRPRRRADSLREHGVRVDLVEGGTASSGIEVGARGSRLVIVGDPDAWQSRWSALSGLRESCVLYFDGCAPSELRAIGRSSDPPPALAGPDRILALHPDGTWQRLRWPRD